MKSILITGSKSYIGESFKNYLLQYPDDYTIDVIDTIGFDPGPELFTKYDVVFNVAGIAHVKETKSNRHLYYDVNRDLVVKIAKAAKAGGVKQFILLSTMSVYGITTGYISKATVPHPCNSYGDSKLQGDEIIKELESESFMVTILRPPMVYGKDCKGNYQSLRKFALKTAFFPCYQNQRSMVYIGNLCEFVKTCIDEERRGLFFPQNDEYICTSEMVSRIAEEHKKKIRFTKAFNWVIKIACISIVKKVFGTLVYEKVDLVEKYGFIESIKLTEERDT